MNRTTNHGPWIFLTLLALGVLWGCAVPFGPDGFVQPTDEGKGQIIPVRKVTLVGGPRVDHAMHLENDLECSDCHDNDGGPGAGGNGPKGPHGSRWEYLLKYRYETRGSVVENAASYRLCYDCHQRASILGDESFSDHKKHVVDERTPRWPAPSS